MKKRVIIIILVVILCIAAIGGIIIGVRAYQRSRLVADVEYVGNLNWGYYGGSMESDGMVSNDASQSVYLENSQIVEEVYVTEGQEVSVGDPLMSFDITSLELSVEIKKLEIQSLGNQYTAATEELKKLKATKPVEKQTAVPAAPAEPEPTEPAAPAEPELPEQNEDGSYNIIRNNEAAYNADTAAGDMADPYRFRCSQEAYVCGSYLNYLYENGKCAVFEIWSESGELMASWTVSSSLLTGGYDEEERWYIFYQSDNYEETGDTAEPVDIPDTTVVEDMEEGYTAEELAKAIQDKEQQIKRLDLDKRKAELELSDMEEEVEDGVVYAKVNGVVKTVGDPENPPQDGSAFLFVTGSDGLYVKGTISELQLDNIEIGQSVTAMSWETGAVFEATITSIDNYPEENSYYYGESNPNSSYYGYTAYIEDPTGLSSGQYLQLTIDTGMDDDAMNSIYIEQCYVREEDGKSYVLKDENGYLKKQYVTTGKLLWGSAIEITSGITEEDYIAFPYGKTAQEGIKTSRADE